MSSTRLAMLCSGLIGYVALAACGEFSATNVGQDAGPAADSGLSDAGLSDARTADTGAADAETCYPMIGGSVDTFGKNWRSPTRTKPASNELKLVIERSTWSGDVSNLPHAVFELEGARTVSRVYVTGSLTVAPPDSVDLPLIDYGCTLDLTNAVPPPPSYFFAGLRREMNKTESLFVQYVTGDIISERVKWTFTPAFQFAFEVVGEGSNTAFATKINSEEVGRTVRNAKVFNGSPLKIRVKCGVDFWQPGGSNSANLTFANVQVCIKQ